MGYFTIFIEFSAYNHEWLDESKSEKQFSNFFTNKTAQRHPCFVQLFCVVSCNYDIINNGDKNEKKFNPADEPAAYRL